MPASLPVHEVPVRDGVVLGRPELVLIAGPCVVESEDHALALGRAIADIARRAGVPYIFKASFDKANRTSRSGRIADLAIEEGLAVLGRVREAVGVPVLTDIHEPWQAAEAAEVADVLQIPAFLSRQTDLIMAAAETGHVVNLKKGQFLAPLDMRHAVDKVRVVRQLSACSSPSAAFPSGTTTWSWTCARFRRCAAWASPVVFDVTHSLQLPGGGEGGHGGPGGIHRTAGPCRRRDGHRRCVSRSARGTRQSQERRAERAGPRPTGTASGAARRNQPGGEGRRTGSVLTDHAKRLPRIRQSDRSGAARPRDRGAGDSRPHPSARRRVRRGRQRAERDHAAA